MKLRRLIGLALVIVGVYLALNPLVVADALGKPYDTAPRLMNLRASYGGALLGIGAFLAWVPAFRPWWRPLVGLVGWSMAGVGLARLTGFLLDGTPDTRQIIWITAEVILTAGSALVLYRTNT
jgi:Domain of unknown function (DUF4345)